MTFCFIEDKISHLPEEATITDPLYEPIKLKIYPMCKHVEWLSYSCHLPNAFSSHLLYDIEKMKDVSQQIINFDGDKHPLLSYRAKTVVGFYYPLIRRLIGIYFYYLEIDQNEVDPDLSSDKILIKIEHHQFHNTSIAILGLIREYILFLFKEIQSEYLKILYGELLAIPSENKYENVNVRGSRTICSSLFFQTCKTNIECISEIADDLADITSNYLLKLQERITLRKEDSERDLNKKTLAKKLKPEILDFLRSEEFSLNVHVKFFSDQLKPQYDKQQSGKNDYYKKLDSMDKSKIFHEFDQEISKPKIELFNPDWLTITNSPREYVDGFLFEYTKLDNDHYKRGFLERNYRSISTYFFLDNQLYVTCPFCKKEFVMTEHGRIYFLKEALLKTFELRRAKWLLMSSALHNYFCGATHTRLAHQIGTLMVTINALEQIKVNIHNDFTVTLAEYLSFSENMDEFILANVLHDTGHPPMSHVLEVNPLLQLDHEDITKNLILGEDNRLTNLNGNVNWYKLQYSILLLNYTHGFIETFNNIKSEDRKRIAVNAIEFIKSINNVIHSEVVLIHGVIKNFGQCPATIVQMLDKKNLHKGLLFQQQCKIFNDTLKKQIDTFQPLRISDLQFLNMLIESEIDFDRIDHVKRDSMMTGVSLVGFKLDDLLGSITIILPESHIHKKIWRDDSSECDENSYLAISENGYKYFMDLLTTRKLIFDDILFSDQNNWINGLINQISYFAVLYQPHLKNIYPFVTDPIMFHIFGNQLSSLQDFRRYNRLLQGRERFSILCEPYRYKLNSDKSLNKEQIRLIFDAFEQYNRLSGPLRYPRAIFYTNIKGSGMIKSTKTKWNDYFIYGKNFHGKYYKLTDLAKIKDGIYGNLFNMPNEKDLNNIFYIWVSNLSLFSDNNPSQKKVDEIEKQIKSEFKKRIQIEFDEYFIDRYLHPDKMETLIK